MTGWGGTTLEFPVYQIPGTFYTVTLFDLLVIGGGGILLVYGHSKESTPLMLVGVLLLILGLASVFVPGGLGV